MQTQPGLFPWVSQGINRGVGVGGGRRLCSHLFWGEGLHWVLVQHTGPFIVAHRLFSSSVPWAPERMGSVVTAHGLSCSVACGILVSWQGIEPAPPALKDGFLTSELQRKSPSSHLECGFGKDLLLNSFWLLANSPSRCWLTTGPGFLLAMGAVLKS